MENNINISTNHTNITTGHDHHCSHNKIKCFVCHEESEIDCYRDHLKHHHVNDEIHCHYKKMKEFKHDHPQRKINEPENPYRILSLDGGGIRGLIPAMILEQIEKDTGKRIHEMFDMIAGTSTGGILSLGLTKRNKSNPNQPQFAASDLVELYKAKGKDIFVRSSIFNVGGLYQSKYSKDGIEKVLKEYFDESILEESLIDVLVTGTEVEIGKSAKSVRFCKNSMPKMKCFDTTRITTSAPTYFPAYNYENKIYVDGGVIVNNPALVAFAEAEFKEKTRKKFILSIGNGLNKNKTINSGSINNGALFWAQEFPNISIDGSSNNNDEILDMLVNSGGHEFVRLQKEVNDLFQLDDYRTESINKMIHFTNEWIHELKSNGTWDKILNVINPKPVVTVPSYYSYCHLF